MAKQKSWNNYYEIIDELGEGGNAKVYRVKCKEDNEEYALKVLVVGGKEKHSRFVNEINTIKDNYQIIEGIIPIYRFSVEEYWYTMPIAISAVDYILENKLDIEEIVKGIISLSETLEKLHEKDICHRDIKPSNIYYYNNRFAFGDFGLVDFPNNTDDFTKSDKGLGAIFTIAPEMKRNPKKADSKKADAFSLAKTMWMFLTNNEKGFDGVYNYLDPSHSLRYLEQYKNTHLVEIDELLKDSTDNNPDVRPTIEEFKERLINWIGVYSDIDKSQASDWNFLNKQLFGLNPPESSSWRNINKIVEILNIIGKTPAYNHMLFHDKGGLDFSFAEIADEENCIKLYDTSGFCYIVRPKILYFEGFNENYRWNYFLLEFDKLSPILSAEDDCDNEHLVEDYPAHYVSAQYAQYGVYDYETAIPLPKGFQTVYRYIRGKFLIVLKNGPYNGINGTYDGRHGDCSASEFRNYIEWLLNLYSKLYQYIKSNDEFKGLPDEEIEDRILNLGEFNKNPFKKDLFKEYDVSNRKKKYSERKKSKDYIKQNFMNWDFCDMLQICPLTNSATIKFVFEFLPSGNEISLGLFEEMNYYICTDGHIKKMNPYSDEKCFCLYDRKATIDLEYNLEKRVSEILKQNGLAELEYETYFSVRAIRCGKPIHLFTKQEIEVAMRYADDRLDNQLVIDENGYAKVIERDEGSYLYPVRHELWCSGNMYVGKYSSLSTLEDDYISSLQGWLLYLKTGRPQYMDYVHDNRNEKDLIQEIMTYY
ncbi:serine/threonine protein kinase [Streptococcus sp. GMD4S]|jgi:histidine kinase|uniref:protein kinase domain-containing protein n=1 Tax=unclassified Streptococcus TaxID=2608887 RepID=UPI000280D5E0|nr:MULTISPECIES: protein kinase [unclassified Streptococcus]EKA02677.1 serine/threonine protein kinase [Streptococcus sp. GMD4S]EKA09912.1 serine/threonine protein kinase [Streptococcus sp. GMD2S]EKA18327.1 serine/threonine protein kinase [Streptococcus sp. GMD1S]